MACLTHQVQPLSLKAEQVTFQDMAGPKIVLAFWKYYLFLSTSEAQHVGPFQVASDL